MSPVAGLRCGLKFQNLDGGETHGAPYDKQRCNGEDRNGSKQPFLDMVAGRLLVVYREIRHAGLCVYRAVSLPPPV